MGKIQISTMQFFILIFMFIVSSSTLLIPNLVTPYAKQDVWLATIVGALLAVPLLLLYISLARRYPDLTLTEYSERILGRWGGKLVSFLFFTYFLIITGGLIRQVGDMLTTLILPETPLQAVIAIFAFVLVIGVRLGLESWARSAEIFFPWVLLFLGALVATLAPLIQIDYMLPLFEAPPGHILRGAITVLGVPFFDLVIFLMIAPHVKSLKGVQRGFLYGALVGTTIIVTITLLTTLILGVTITEQTLYPVYQLAQKVSIGNFIQRIEVLVGGIWLITMFFKITVCFYATVLSLTHLFNLKHYKPLTLPVGLLMVPFSLLMFRGLISFLDFVSEIWTVSVALYGIILPLLLLVVDIIRRGRKAAAHDTQ